MKRRIAFNKLFNLFIIIGVFLIIAGCIMIKGDEEEPPQIGLGVVLGVIGFALVGVPAVLMPFIYVFDEEGVSLCYILLPNERYLWKKIHHIEATDDSVGSSRSAIFDLLFTRVFEISGSVEGQPRFYMNGKIRRSMRTKYLLERYWDGEITGYLFDGVKERMREQRAKKECRTIDTTEIAAQEREARKNVKLWVEPYLATVKQLNLGIDTRFIYVTRELEESNSRPKKQYTYVTIAKISANGEENKDKFTEVSVDLLYGRIGKKAFIGTANKIAREELCFYLDDTLEEIRKSGIEAYLDK